MKYLFLILGLVMPAVVPAQALFTWDLLWTGSWEESKTLNNRGDFRFGFSAPGLLFRAQALDRHTINFELDPVWGDPSKGITSGSCALYHKPTDSRFLYGVIDEWGLPARIRSPWIRAAPYAETRKPSMADLRTTASSTKKDELYLYLSSPRLKLERVLPELSLRGYASGQFTPSGIALENPAPAFTGGLEGTFDELAYLSLEGFYTGFQLPAKQSSAWFSDPPPLPDRDFRLGAAALALKLPWLSFTSDWAWSETFAYGSGVYGNAGLRINPPLFAPWSLSLAADGMSERYTGSDGSNPGGGVRMAGKIERKGKRSNLFRASGVLRGPAVGEAFERSSMGLYYRFPASAPRVKSGGFPLRIRRVALNVDRNASDRKKINDGIDGSLGLSFNPININLATSIDWLARADDLPSPFPFFPPGAFSSTKTSCELLWSPRIFQFRTRWAYTAYAKKDNQWEASVSAAARFKHGRFSVKFAWPVFPDKWNCTLSWRVEK